MSESSGRISERRGSLVWPILLIGAGVIFLLANLDLLPANSWVLLARLWPLALILLGLDILVGRRSTFGMLISGLVALLLVLGLIALLLLAPRIPALDRIGGTGELQTQALQAPLENVQSARVTIDWTPGENRLNTASSNSVNLIEGQVTYYGDLVFDVSTQGTRSEVLLDSRSEFTGFFLPSWEETRWSISLHPEVIYELVLDAGSGQHEFDLSALQLSDFTLDSGSGQVNLSLPAGNYRAVIDGGSGALSLKLPQDAAARIELDSGSGRFDPGPFLELVSGEAGEDSVWETANFGLANERITLVIDQGSGAIQIEP